VLVLLLLLLLLLLLQWPGATHFPDFLSKRRTWPWWQQQLARMYSQVKFDGLWIDMNEVRF
jgi:alpha-glucosidase (family GH31 glycosyl hydrolase)